MLVLRGLACARPGCALQEYLLPCRGYANVMMTVSIEVGPVCFETEIRGEYHPEVYRDMLRLASDHVYSLQARLSDAVSVPEGSDSLSEQDGLEDVYRLDADEDPASP